MTKLTVNGLALVDQFTLANKTEDHKEGVAAFLERRKPQLRGRQPRFNHVYPRNQARRL